MADKIFFASDFHLGIPDYKTSLEREKDIVKWLSFIEKDAKEIYLLGDLFDFWFEYKKVVPKGYVRLLSKLGEFSDNGIKVNYFTGNHDMWIYNYFTEELGINIIRQPVEKIIYNKRFYIGHGDGLGPGDYGYKFIKYVFSLKISQKIFSLIHPYVGISIANYWSKKSRIVNSPEKEIIDNSKELLVNYITEMEKHIHYDYYLFGHRHLPLIKEIGNSFYINTGDWVYWKTYVEYNGEELKLIRWTNNEIIYSVK